MDDPIRSARPPLNPMRLARWLWRLTLDVVNEYRRDGVGDLAASITFWTLLSIPAAILALLSAVSAIEPLVGTSVSDDVQDAMQDFVSDTFADSDALNSAVAELFDSGNAGVITVAAAVAFFSLSRGFAGLIRALDRAYGVEEGRAWWHVRLVAIGLGLGTTIIVAAGATVLALAPELPGGITRALTLPGAFLGLIAWAATMFHVGPYHRTPWRWDVPGAILTAVGWVLATQGFALYVRFSSSANEVQTFVGAILLGLTLLYLLSIVMLVGAELNDVLAARAGVVQQPERWGERAHRIRRLVRRRIAEKHAADAAEEAAGESADEPSSSETESV